jgi:hypothetical protein
MVQSINWADWVAKKPAQLDKLDKWGLELAEKCAPGQTKYVVSGDRMVVVTKDPNGNVRTFDTQIKRWNIALAQVLGNDLEDDEEEEGSEDV